MHSLTDWTFLILGILVLLLLIETFVMDSGTHDPKWIITANRAHLVVGIFSTTLLVVGLSMGTGLVTGIPQDIAWNIAFIDIVIIGFNSYLQSKRLPDVFPNWPDKLRTNFWIGVVTFGGILLLIFWLFPIIGMKTFGIVMIIIGTQSYFQRNSIPDVLPEWAKGSEIFYGIFMMAFGCIWLLIIPN
jgi:hypothetical protein